MARAVLLALIVSACAASSPAPISYGGAPRQEGRRAAPVSYASQPNAQPRTHRVAADESLFDIAETYQIPLRSLIEQNALEPPYRLAPGREIELPPPRVHRVARGETFADVAQRYNVDLRSLGLLNRMTPPYAVREGQAITLPALARPRAVAPPASAPLPTSAPPVAANTAARFAWPLRGEVLARFGAQESGRRLDGVEIAAEEGAAVSAAADGEVVYAGDDLSAYGALVLVRHADGYVTAYGYGRRALVREGQRVRAGQPIAEVARMGERSPRLLFQVRRGTEPVDPLPLMRD